ncbi:MAG: signal peptidase I [Hyphomicrobiaceae bacterium]|nr:signal peptidase I [Hyphomicrobiaceae bacterium]
MSDNSSGVTATPRKSGGFGEILSIVFQALLLALLVRTLLFQPFSIPSGSMKSTLLVGDYLFVSKYAYGFSKYSIPFSPDLFEGRIMGALPKRGDVVVFKLPTDNQTDYIKRVMALPGDRIQIVGGEVILNGRKFERKRLPDFVEVDSRGNAPALQAYLETNLDGKSYTTLNKYDNGPVDDTPVFVVPEGHVFCMGDNRDDSTDSRFMGQVGFIPVENLVGRAEVLFYSIEPRDGLEPWTWPARIRWSRLFTGLRP